MKFGLQEYAVYCTDTSDWCSGVQNVMAMSPEDARHQLEVRGFVVKAWMTADGYGEYQDSTERV